ERWTGRCLDGFADDAAVGLPAGDGRPALERALWSEVGKCRGVTLERSVCSRESRRCDRIEPRTEPLLGSPEFDQSSEQASRRTVEQDACTFSRLAELGARAQPVECATLHGEADGRGPELAGHAALERLRTAGQGGGEPRA